MMLQTLDDLRWKEDRVVTTPFGDRVWLKQAEYGLLDCCLESSPCEFHSRLTNPAPGGIQ